MSKLLQNKIVNLFVKSLLFLTVIIILYILSINNLGILGEIIIVVGNWILHSLLSLEDLKFFVDKVEINKLTLFFRYEQVMAGPQFTFVTNDFLAHFIFPLIFFVGLISTNIIDNFKNKNYYLKSIFGFLIIILYYIFKLLILGYHNSLKVVVFNTNGTIKSVENGVGIWFDIIDLLNNIFNVYGSITLRLIFVLAIWIMLFNFNQIKSKLLKEI